jgi:HEAT repeat protein
MLIEDQEWFVRLRAVVALGSIRETGRIRLLLRALCDANRYVRQRAAWSLARFQPNLDAILELVLETKDSFALQAFISELERSGDMEKLIQALQAESDQDTAQAVLLKALAVGRERVETARQPKAIGAAAGAGK